MFRSEKVSKNWDDFKVLSIGMAVFSFIYFQNEIQSNFYDQRWYRDLFKLTPFHSVKVHETKVVNNKIYIAGELIKRRCTFHDLRGYVYDEDGLGNKVFVDTSIEDAKGVSGSRPSSNKAERWGIWSLTWNDTRYKPVSWAIYAKHIKCPSKPIEQTNLFISGKWKNFKSKQKDSR